VFSVAPWFHPSHAPRSATAPPSRNTRHVIQVGRTLFRKCIASRRPPSRAGHWDCPRKASRRNEPKLPPLFPPPRGRQRGSCWTCANAPDRNETKLPALFPPPRVARGVRCRARRKAPLTKRTQTARSPSARAGRQRGSCQARAKVATTKRTQTDPAVSAQTGAPRGHNKGPLPPPARTAAGGAPTCLGAWHGGHLKRRPSPPRRTAHAPDRPGWKPWAIARMTRGRNMVPARGGFCSGGPFAGPAFHLHSVLMLSEEPHVQAFPFLGASALLGSTPSAIDLNHLSALEPGRVRAETACGVETLRSGGSTTIRRGGGRDQGPAWSR